jgi:hypothetical protein
LKYREEAYESMIPQTWKRLLDNNCKFSEDWSHCVIESVIRGNLMARPEIRIEL